jgi:phosphoribosyl 1,2-cyclic phosphodiesterase
MKVRLWGTRGSVASPGADTARYGGNTSCVEVCGAGDTVAVLDAGTGIRPLGTSLDPRVRTVHILLSHLHMDHIQGLGFFKPLFDPEVETHLWGPAVAIDDLRRRLVRYLSPPLFPVHLRDLPRCVLHDMPTEPFQVGDLRVTAERVCHPGHTVGFRIEQNGTSMAYLSDHEPALGAAHFPLAAEWTSGYAIAKDVDLLIHDAQYSLEEYAHHVGWGHSALDHALAFARLVRARRLVTFHHDPSHSDDDVDRLTAAAIAACKPPFAVLSGAEGAVFDLASVAPSSPRR